MDALNHRAWALRDTQPEQALVLFEQARALAQSDGHDGLPYRLGLANSLVGLARLLSADPETSARYSLQAIELLEGDPPSSLLVDAHIALGWVHFFVGDYSAALEWALRAQASGRAVARPDQEARALDLVASVHAVQGNFAEARREHEAALQTARAAQNVYAQISISNNLAMTLLEAGHYPAALEQGQHSLDLARQHGHVIQITNVQDTVAQILVAMNDFPRAEANLQQALQSVVDRDTLSQTYLRKNLGRVYLAQQDPARAASQLEQALALAVAWGYRSEEADCHQWLCAMCEQQGDLAGALEHYRQFHALKEAVAGAERAKRLALLQVVHEVETAKRDAEIQRLRNAELQSEIEERKSVQTLLELRVAERTHELRLAKEAAEAANRAKTAFLSIMGHELRTPLNGIFLAAELLRERHPDLQKDEDLLSAIQMSGQRLLRMVEGVLEYTNMEARPGAAPLEVKPVLDDIAGAFKRRAAARHLSLVFALSPELPLVCFDALALDRVLRRLLENALKYTPEGGRVTVTAVPKEPSALRLMVTDTGPGLKAEDCERIFEPFVQLERSYLEHAEGAGLGLALARRQVELYGGRLWAESAGPGQGSTFVLLLPAAAEPEAGLGG